MLCWKTKKLELKVNSAKELILRPILKSDAYYAYVCIFVYSNDLVVLALLNVDY